jgi:phospholipase C
MRTANQFRTDGAWQYDVGAGATVEDYFSARSISAGRYDLTLSGPNGFERQFVGNINTACGALEVSSTLHPTEETIELSYVNHGSAPVTFTTTATRHRTDGPWMTTVAVGATQTQTLNVATMGNGWYALTVTVSSDTTFRRRFAGHMGNGRAGVTWQ